MPRIIYAISFYRHDLCICDGAVRDKGICFVREDLAISGILLFLLVLVSEARLAFAVSSVVGVVLGGILEEIFARWDGFPLLAIFP